jgi:hypothetical protein
VTETFAREIQELCDSLGARFERVADHIRVEKSSVTLKLVPLDDHVLVSINLTQPSGTRRVGFESIPRTRVLEFLMYVLPLESITVSDLELLSAFG